MNLKINIILACSVLMLAHVSYAQQQISTDYFAGIKKINVSKLWFNDLTVPENDSISATLPEPLGFIGDNFQRFYIHFISVKKSEANPYQYIVTGKTKVKENVCNFSGTITVTKAGIYKEQIDKDFKQGFVECNIIFYEDSLQKATGLFKGKLTSKFFLDKQNVAWYDDIEVGADAYFNNQCEATWTSYATGKTKKCNWGDFRIPQSKALDSGDGEFAVDKKYDSYGWKNYRIAWSSDPWKNGTQQAREAENIHWWE
ncbi:MAG: hypothetical protein ABIN25_05710 [Ginsengibacter sp.]